MDLRYVRRFLETGCWINCRKIGSEGLQSDVAQHSPFLFDASLPKNIRCQWNPKKKKGVRVVARRSGGYHGSLS